VYNGLVESASKLCVVRGSHPHMNSGDDASSSWGEKGKHAGAVAN